MHVWTLPQGGTFVSLPNILNSQGQDKSTDVKVSLDLLLELLFAATVLLITLNVGMIKPYQDFMLLKLYVHFILFWPVVFATVASDLAHVIIQLCFVLQQEHAKCVFVLHGHITAVKSLSFCSSGLALVSGGIGGLLNIWSLQVRKQHTQFAWPEVSAKSPYLTINFIKLPKNVTIIVYYSNICQGSHFRVLILRLLCASYRMVQFCRLLQVWVQSSVLPGYQTWV